MADVKEQTFGAIEGQPLQVALFYAIGCDVQFTANEVTLVLNDSAPIAGPGGVLSDTQIIRPIIMVKLSPQTAKDIGVTLVKAVQDYQKKFSTILVTNDTSAQGE